MRRNGGYLIESKIYFKKSGRPADRLNVAGFRCIETRKRPLFRARIPGHHVVTTVEPLRIRLIVIDCASILSRPLRTGLLRS